MHIFIQFCAYNMTSSVSCFDNQGLNVYGGVISPFKVVTCNVV